MKKNTDKHNCRDDGLFNLIHKGDLTIEHELRRT